jgi:hypothetical protein
MHFVGFVLDEGFEQTVDDSEKRGDQVVGNRHDHFFAVLSLEVQQGIEVLADKVFNSR